MDDSTFSSDAAAINRHSLLEQLAIIRSLFRKESSADDDAATAAARNRNVVEGRAREGVRLINDQMAAVSTELLLTVMSDMMLLRLLDGLRLEEGRTVSSDASSSDGQLMDDATAAKKKRKKAAAKRRRYKRNKATAKQQHKKTMLMSWLGGGIISVIMMVAFSFISTPIVTLSLFQPSDGSGEGKAPPALPPSVSRSLRQKDLKSKNEASTSPDIIRSPLAAVVPPPIFAPAAVSNRRMKLFDNKMRESTCLDTPNWKDNWGDGCDWYRYSDEEGCPDAVALAGDMGPSTQHCCHCGGGSTTCEDWKSICQKYINVLDLGFNEIGLVAPLCKEAESCSCEAADHDVEIVYEDGVLVGLYNYNECKCDFWSRLCEDSGVGEACDYAAEYCCGDYLYDDNNGFIYLSSPTCYCDFFNYARNELGHKLKPKALNISKEFDNPCGQIQDHVESVKSEVDFIQKFERPSLEAIYIETNGENWTNSAGWMNEPDHCQWYGITCDGDSFVTGIDLRDNNLAGQFPVYTRNTFDGEPFPESVWPYTKYGVANLFYLKTLDLSDNKLTGTIEYRPLYNLHSLTHFDVSGNQLSGDVDALISPSLTYVDISNNNFTSMRRFKKYKVSPLQTLRFCDLSNNTIQNDASDILENIPPNIEQFLASKNRINGNLPDSLNVLPKLRHFDMSSNALSGSLPVFADSILSLQELDMSKQKNGFTGSIPEDIWGFQFLRIMNLAGNKLTGTIPPVARSSLKILNLTENELEGIIPPSIGSMTLLEVLDLSDNLLRSTIPSELGNGILKLLDFSNNTLTGTIPSQLGQLQGASILLDGNVFDNETAPLSLCLREVKEFDLAFHPTFCPIERNALVEFYDSAKGAKWTDGSLWLDEDASYCGWKGVSCNVDGRVTKLHLANNGLSGMLSERIRNFHFIEELDLSDNDIKGSIPAEIDSLSYLTYLRLSSNAFTGTIPTKIGLLSTLTYLSLNDNAFTGSIPEDIWGSQSLNILNLAGNKLAGTIPPMIGDMTVLEVLELSSNSLSGPIPFQIGQLEGAGVLKRLDLASNSLTGTIPSQLGKLQNASILLEGNRFNNSVKTAPLSLCMLRNVKEFDLANDMAFCPIERNALSDFYDSANGTGWTNGTLWLDEYTSYCDWTGVTCEEGRHVTELNLTNNGLLGRLSKSIGDLTFIEVLDLSSNEIKESIPTEIGLLSKLTHLRLSYNAFTGSIPGDLGRFLKIMNLAGNELTGSIPEDLGRFQSLKIMNLAGNKLTGAIPPTIGDTTVLEVLELSSNSLSGLIPFQIGQLAGTLKRLSLSNNTLSGTIPSQIGQLQGASILLDGNVFDNKTAPLSLCMLHRIGVEAFDLAREMTFCPIERNALSDFYESAKGAEWTDRTNWLDGDEYASYCNWAGVTCNEMNRLTELNLTNNGLSGRLSESIGNLTFIQVLDLSDNDIKGSIPTEIGKLSNLTYLRLSYNAFTGAAPGVLGELTKLQVLQLQSNRITKIPNIQLKSNLNTEMPNIPNLNEIQDKKSTFVTDCGVPSAFDETPECENCTMCCNANEDCYPQEDTHIAEHLGLNYSEFAAVLIACFVAFCCMVSLSLYLFNKRKNRGNALTTSTERRLEEDDTYALSRIGKDSVYSYFVTEKPLGWLAAFATLGIQIGILAFFVMASEPKLQEDTIDIQFTWKCPRDSDVCDNKADLSDAGWFIFSMLMVAFLAKDMINGCKLINHSSKVSHTLGSRIRYFIGGMCLCSITLFALYVSTVYNKAIATSNTDIIVNSVIVLFIMEIDEYIFAALEASNKKWTAHVAESDYSSLVAEVSEMKEKFELQRAKIESQQEQIDNQQSEMKEKFELQRAQIESQQEQIDNQQEQINSQQEELKMLREMVEKIQESQAAAAAAATTSDSESAGVECEGSTNVQVQQMEQADQIAMPCEAEENTQESKAAAAASDLESEV